MDPFIISVDLGTTGTKAALFDLNGRLIADAYEETRLIYPKPGLVEQDPEDFYTSSINTIKQLVAKSKVDPGEVKALAFDSQMAGVMGIDSQWKPATHYDSWLDSRCRRYVEMIRSSYENLVIEKVGAPPSISHGPKILWWMYERPAAFRRVSKFIMPNCYVAGRMAQLKSDEAFIDYTFLHFTGFADAMRGEWSQELCELFKVPMEKFPRIVKPWEIIGELSEREAEKCGLAAGTPIVAGAGDTAANAFGAGIVEPGMVFDSAGTASVFACCVDEYVPDVENKTFIFPRSVIPGLWTPLAYIGGGGLCLRWFRDELAQHEKSLADSRNIDPYKLLDDLAEKAPIGSEGLIFIPHFGGRIYPYNASMRGVWFGLNWRHKKEHLYRSILESIAYEYSYYKAVLEKLFPKIRFKEVRVVGGGARSRVFNKIKADVLGIPYVRLNREEFGVLGLAVIAGHGIGEYRDLKEKPKEFAKPSSIVEPTAENYLSYRRYAEIYLELMERLDPLFVKLTQKPET